MNKILTVIIPTYNMEQYISRCLESLITNDICMNLLEVLVINDGSKDNSLSIAKVFESKFPNTFRVIDKQNGNYGSCINRGLKEASGKYVKILDADDYFERDSLKEYINLLLNNDVDLVLSDFKMVDNDGNCLKTIRYTVFGDNKILDFNVDLARSDMWMHAVAYKTENLKSMGYKQTEGISYTDQEWIFMPMISVHRFVHFQGVLYNYVIGRAGQSVDKSVLSKNFSHEVKGLMVMVEQYNKIKLCNISTNIKNYIESRLIYRCDSVYSNYLIYLRNFLRIEDLVEIDKKLKIENSDVYKLSSNHAYSIFRYHYIRDWRCSGYKDSLKLKMYRWYMKKRHS